MIERDKISPFSNQTLVEKARFFANLSHDIKTPLTGIIGLAELLTYKLQGETQELAEAILASGQQLLTFVDNCLKAASINESETSYVPEHFQLRLVLNEILELFQPAIQSKALEFGVYYTSGLPEYLIGHREGLYRILLNLVSNALKFTHSGKISITLSKSSKSTPKEVILIINVDDTGIGIPNSKIESIFERFIQLNKDSINGFEGRGLGLHIVQSHVKNMNGEIVVSSEEGKGSQFKVVIPFAIPLLGAEQNVGDASLLEHYYEPLTQKGAINHEEELILFREG